MHTPLLSENSTSYDLVIIGGGCAGLALAMAICKRVTKPSHAPKTLIIEPRAQYIDDRSWCFWERENKVNKNLVAKSWPTWEFGTKLEQHKHSSKSGWQYNYVPSIRFYDQAEQLISKHEQITLLKNTRVTGVTPNPSNVEVTLDSGSISAEQVVDTRVPDSFDMNKATLKQIFYGIEIELTTKNAIEDIARVMEDMRADSDGFLFNYILPIDEKSILVEVTRFSGAPLAPETLREAALELANHISDQSKYKITREESGVIPMGVAPQVEAADPRWLRTGIGVGAARPSAGYAFQRIQGWADMCAKTILASGQCQSFPSDSAKLAWMDNIFLCTIRDDPTLAPELFLSLARNVKPDRLLRFLTDCPNRTDVLAVIVSLPKWPLVRTVLVDLFRGLSTRKRGGKWRKAL